MPSNSAISVSIALNGSKTFHNSEEENLPKTKAVKSNLNIISQIMYSYVIW